MPSPSGVVSTHGAGGGDASANTGFIVLIVAVATLGGFMFGYDSGVINGTQQGLEQAFHLTALGTGLNVAAILLGCAAGAFAAGRLSDHYGRRKSMIVAAALFILSAIGAGAAPSSGVFVIARFIGGLGVGAASILSPAYIGEVTPARTRGRLISLQQIMIIIGLTGAFLVNYALARVAGSTTAKIAGAQAWRWMFWVQVIPAGVFFLSLLRIPESPRFLVARGRVDEASRVLTRLFGAARTPLQLRAIQASVSREHPPRFSDLRNPATGRIRRIVWTGLAIAVFQQLVGINIVFYYGATLWQAVGFSEHDALLTNILSGSLSIVSCLIAIAVIDRIGRKPMLLIGSAGMAVALALVAYAFSTGALVNGKLVLPHEMATLAFIAANFYAALFNFSWGPVMWVMLGEMFPNQIRGSALAIAGFGQWIANFAITASFPWAAGRLGLPITYGFYAVAALVSFFIVRSSVRETRGRELEAMEG